MRKAKAILLILLIVGVAYAATKNIVPRADSEGQIGTSSKYWDNGYFDDFNVSININTPQVTLTDQDAAPDGVWPSGAGRQRVPPGFRACSPRYQLRVTRRCHRESRVRIAGSVEIWGASRSDDGG